MGARIRRACPGVKRILQNLQKSADNLQTPADFWPKSAATLHNLHDYKLNCTGLKPPAELQTEDYLLGAVSGPACGCGLGLGLNGCWSSWDPDRSSRMSDFKKLQVWQKAHALSLSIDRVCKRMRGSQHASLRSQSYRAAMSISKPKRSTREERPQPKAGPPIAPSR
jgi:hypothetical protein